MPGPDTDTVTIRSDALAVTIADAGAETQAIRDAQGRDWLWQGDPAWWAGRAPILFPVVGETPGGHVTIDGTAHPMGRHGFARCSRFARETPAPDGTRVTHVLTDSAKTRAQYPFGFHLAVTHALDGATLHVDAQVTNPGAAPLPFSLGFHPAFAWPLPGAAGRAHVLELENGADPLVLRLDGDGLLDPALFDADALIVPQGAGDALRYGPAGGPQLAFRARNTGHLGLWQKPGAPFLCIEPWAGMAAQAGAGPALEDRPGLRWLAPGATETFGWSVTVPV